jgi:alkanesulfonate monooxygenase SsuD/methylene tetrahydromethanopterin reductase-like flavin-dependent oxidoreductase (luciferase family)
MQLTMEPLEEMLESARVMDRAGIDTIWLAEAYPWWRKHGMEARSSTVVSGLIAKATEAPDRGPGDHLAVATPMRSRWMRESCRRLQGRDVSCQLRTSKIF